MGRARLPGAPRGLHAHPWRLRERQRPDRLCGPYRPRPGRARADAQAAKTLAHELAHVLLHDDPHNRRTRDHCEVEAESVAYIVLQAQGVETDGYSLPYVAGWSGGKAEVVADTAARVLATAAAILADLTEAR